MILSDFNKVFSNVNFIKQYVEDNIKIPFFCFLKTILIGGQYRRLLKREYLKYI